MKKICVLIISFVMLSNLFAQNTESVGLTNNDVKNWAKNCIPINNELKQFGFEYEETFNVAINAREKVENILEKNGISKPNNINKFIVIMQCVSVIKAENEMDDQTKAIMKQMNIDPLKELKLNINSKDYEVVANNSAIVLKAVDDLDNYDFSSDDDNSDNDDSDNGDYDSEATAQIYQALSAYEDDEEKEKKEIINKYDTKRKFPVVKESDGTEWIIIKPSEITFENCREAYIYAESYTGVSGDWELCNSCGYLGTKGGNKPFYTWSSDGVFYYSKFPIDLDTCAPDKFIPDEEVTPEIAKKAILQMYKE